MCVCVCVNQDLDYLEQIWELTQEWEMAWDTWKGGTFEDLQTDNMGMQAQAMLKRLTKLAREVKVCIYMYIVCIIIQHIHVYTCTCTFIIMLCNVGQE